MTATLLTSLERTAVRLLCSAAVALTVGLAVSEAWAQCTAQVRVMSYNILRQGYWDEKESINDRWGDETNPRRDRVLAIINSNGPDILGVQEANSLQVTDLANGLAEYGFYEMGDHGDKDDGGSHNAIFYSTPRFTQVGQGTFWYSNDPDVRGENYAACTNGAPAWPRMASWVKLYDSATDLTYFVLNTHWDRSCNSLEAALVRQKIKELAGGDPPAIPVIITGDLNSEPDKDAIKELTNREDHYPGEFELWDTHVEVHGVPGSFGNCYTGETGDRVDYVLHSSHFTATDAWTDDSTVGGYCASDHWPEVAEL
jgi:endonuclease/exonuclease/phosphatase family metal-dependent hydrolase